MLSLLCVLFSTRYPSVVNYGQGLNGKYAGEAVWGVLRLFSKNTQVFIKTSCGLIFPGYESVNPRV